MTNCTFAAKKSGGARQKKIPGALRRTCPLPHFQIRSGATALKIPPHPKCVATLPCEMSVS